MARNPLNRCLDITLILGLFALLSPALRAQSLDFALDNDIVFGRDSGYSNGVKLGWTGDSCNGCLADGMARLFQLSTDDSYSLGLQIRQFMITPEDINKVQPQYDDIPYVGTLMADLIVYGQRPDRVTSLFVTVGTVGEKSGADATQKQIHKMTGSTPPRGWRNQLGDDPIGGIGAGIAWLTHSRELDNGLTFQWSNTAGTRLNNYLAGAGIASFVRLGRNLPGNVIPDYAGMSGNLATPGLFERDGHSGGWGAFAGIGGQLPFYSYIEEHGEAYDYRLSDAIGAMVLGAEYASRGFHISLTLRNGTVPEDQQNKALQFGTLSLIWAL